MRLSDMLQGIAQAVPAVACGCVGPQNGDPVCPCEMRYVKIIDGRYVRVVDLGPVPIDKQFSRKPLSTKE